MSVCVVCKTSIDLWIDQGWEHLKEEKQQYVGQQRREYHRVWYPTRKKLTYVWLLLRVESGD